MTQTMRFLEAGTIRTLLDGDKRILEVLAAPFGSAMHRDKLGQWLDSTTDFMLEIGDRRPVLYGHGRHPDGRMMLKTPVIGMMTAERFSPEGLWSRVELNKTSFADKAWAASLAGRACASTGSVEHMARPLNRLDGSPTPGLVTTWAIAELSIADRAEGYIPVSDDAVVLPLRLIFDELSINLPEAFEQNAVVDPTPAERLTRNKEFTMSEIETAVQAALKAEREANVANEAARAAMRTSIIDELKGDPKYRSVFNIVPEDKSKGRPAEKQETYAYLRLLVEDVKHAGEVGYRGRYTRGLEESEAAELGVLVPNDLFAGISEERGKYSLVRKSGMRTFTTDKLTFTVPVATAMAIIPTVAEEGAYVENAPATVAKTVTLLKKGSLVTVSEESLEDIDILGQWITSEAGKALALAENVTLYDLLASIDGVEVATTKVILDSEILTAYYALAQEYRDNAVWIMNDATIGYLRAQLIATPRAYGDIGFETRMMGDKPGEFFMQHRVFSNANWTSIATTTQDDLKVIDFADLGESVAWADRRGISIFVDPYTVRASAGQVQFLPSARFAGVVLRTTALSGIDGHE